MSALEIGVTQWLGGPANPEDLTVGELRIAAPGCRPFTEVQDFIALTTRDTIRVPAARVAEWLLTRSWRLGWEPLPQTRTREWSRAHSMAAIGGGFAWPALEIAGDGEFVQLSTRRELSADAAAIRYLNEIAIEIPRDDFETAVGRFCDEVEGRIASVAGIENAIGGLREELQAERADPAVSARCRREARAGFDPGDAPTTFHADFEELSKEAGDTAVEDLLVVDPDFAVLRRAFDAVKHARTKVDLSDAPRAPAADGRTKPWQRGMQAAREAREHFGIQAGPVTDDVLGQILGIRLPVEPDAAPLTRNIFGGFRSHDELVGTRALVRSGRVEGQRFYFARLMAMAASLPPSESFLPLADSRTVLQKFARSFAQELLCPWTELDAWTDENGTDAESIQRAAERYRVSEMLIASTLVNRGRLDRGSLARFAE